ncbi:response regulator transcription factor [Myxococcota bacterium]|nr:response regulator transcription factor [Myxococcota bacterium]MBU1380841.1 response regulator transcription factor [Myxococcota bacterium]MBU1499138.1 response regulator transcription factor [Myxococcota bacterium]
MILIVDDDKDITLHLSELLLSGGYQCTTFNDAPSALEFLKQNQPSLIISDIVMPGMSGFVFREHIFRDHPHWTIPFIFLSGMDSEESIIKGLDSGADDYLLKPFNDKVILAKVKALLRRHKKYTEPVFHGNLSNLPFTRLLQFCESQGVTGSLEIRTGNSNFEIPLIRGEVDFDNIVNSDVIFEKLTDTASGFFFIKARTPDFSEIESAVSGEFPVTQIEKPMGMLSGINSGKGIIQIQTEYSSYPEPQIITIVVHNGKTVFKKAEKALDISRDVLEEKIRQQHVFVENDITIRLEKVIVAKQPELTPSFGDLFETGLDHYIKGEYKKALEVWTRAKELDSENKILNINLEIVRKKVSS